MDYPLQKRTQDFSKRLVSFCRKLDKDIVNKPIISQLVRTGTSIGANYREANGASSKNDFRNKIYIAKKEALETQYWLEILNAKDKELQSELLALKQESIELGKILSKIVGTINNT